MSWPTRFGAILTLTCSGCVDTPAPRHPDAALINEQLYKDSLTRRFSQPPSQCFDATLQALAARKIRVARMDRQQRAIWSERAIALESLKASGERSGFVYSGKPVEVRDEHRMALQVDGEGGVNDDGQSPRCVVRAIKYEAWRNDQPLVDVNVNWAKPNLWDPLFAAIQDRLDRGP
jgi:hypothetical protein